MMPIRRRNMYSVRAWCLILCWERFLAVDKTGIAPLEIGTKKQKFLENVKSGT